MPKLCQIFEAPLPRLPLRFLRWVRCSGEQPDVGSTFARSPLLTLFSRCVIRNVALETAHCRGTEREREIERVGVSYIPCCLQVSSRLGWFPGVMEGKPATSGRRKITMELIAKKEARDICFTKRRQGLFKKLCELSRLCGVDTLALVNSSAGKLYPFGTPDVPTAVDRFLMLHAEGGAAAAEGPQQVAEETQQAAEGRQGEVLRELFDELHSLETRLRELQQQRAALARAVEEKASRLPHRWRSKLADLPTEELEEMLVVLQKLQEKVNNVSDPPAESASVPKPTDLESIVDQGFSFPHHPSVLQSTGDSSFIPLPALPRASVADPVHLLQPSAHYLHPPPPFLCAISAPRMNSPASPGMAAIMSSFPPLPEIHFSPWNLPRIPIPLLPSTPISVGFSGGVQANMGSPQCALGPSASPGLHQSALYIPMPSIVPAPSLVDPSAFSVRLGDWEATVKPSCGTLQLLESIHGGSTSQALERNPEIQPLGDTAGLEGFWENGANAGADMEGTDDDASSSSFDYMDFIDIPSDQD